MGRSIKEEMDDNGVVILEGFLSPAEADELRQAGVELEEQRPKDGNSVFSTLAELNDDISKKGQLQDDYFLQSNDKIRYFLEADEIDGEKKLNKVGHALHWHHPLFRFYSFSNRVKETCYSLGMQDPAIVQSMYIYKSARSGGEVKPHQDATYLLTEPQTAIGFWLALEDTTIENGCLWAIKGSHKSGIHRRCIRNPDKTSSELLVYDKPSPLYPVSNFTALPIKKGDCILLHGQLVHSSKANKSNYNRPAYTFHVVEKSAKFSEDNWLQEGPEAPFASLYKTKQNID